MMTPLEFKIIRESFDFSHAEFANILKVARRTVIRWEHGQSKMSPRAQETIYELLWDTNKEIDKNTCNHVLVHFNSARDYKLAGFKNASYKVHNAIVQRAFLNALFAKELAPSIMEFDLKKFNAFLEHHPQHKKFSADSILQNWARWECVK